MDMTLDEISKLLGEITQGDWVAMSLDGYPIVGVKHPPVDDSKKWQLKVISVLTTEQMKGLGKAVKIELDDEDRANLSIIAAAPTIIKELVEQNKALLARNEELQRRVEKMQAVVDAATRLNGSLRQDDNTSSTWTLVQGYLLGDLNAALVGMWSEDAKEQDDD